MLELSDVRKHYTGPDGETIRAVDGVSLTVARGSFVALYGPSGSGKTTLLLLAAGVVRPQAGTIRFAGVDLAALSQREAARYRHRELGFVFQSPRLVPGLSAIDNAGLKLLAGGASRREARRRVAPLLEQLGLERRARHVASQLSRGERQRVALARALANEPQLVLADEPTGNLDSQRGSEVLALLTERCRERQIALLLATHDPAAADFADQAHTLRDGRLLPHAPDRAEATVVR